MSSVVSRGHSSVVSRGHSSVVSRGHSFAGCASQQLSDPRHFLPIALTWRHIFINVLPDSYHTNKVPMQRTCLNV